VELLIGVNPDTYDNDAMALGSVLARASSATPVLTHIYPADPSHSDDELDNLMRLEGEDLLTEAVSRFCDRWRWSVDEVRTALEAHQSSGVGLAETAEARRAAFVVIGSAEGGPSGRFTIGATANQLLHTSTVPVVTAPSGYSRETTGAIRKVLVAHRVGESENSPELRQAAAIAKETSVPLELVTILMRPRMYATRLSPEAEAPLLEHMQHDAAASHQRIISTIDDSIEVTTVTLAADSVGAAFNRYPWEGDELLVIGSAKRGPLLRVFLGDMTHKLLRRAPVPVIVLPHTPS
jgi:nucleotide-binding universal stress UspA family protein